MDEHIGIDYSLLRDPTVSTDTLDLDFKVNTGSCPANPPTVPMGAAVPACTLGTTERAGWAALRLQKLLLFLAQGMFFPRARENQELENHAVEPVIKETERMVYVAFSEYFFDSAMLAYFQAGVLTIELQGEKVSSDRSPSYAQAALCGQGPAARQEGGLGFACRAEEMPSREQLCWDQQQLLAYPPMVCPPCKVPKDLEVLLRATFFGTIFMLVRGAPGRGGRHGGATGAEHSPAQLHAFSSPAFLRALLWMLPCGWCCRCRLPPAASSNPRAPPSPSLPSSTSHWCPRAALLSSSPAWPW